MSFDFVERSNTSGKTATAEQRKMSWKTVLKTESLFSRYTVRSMNSGLPVVLLSDETCVTEFVPVLWLFGQSRILLWFASKEKDKEVNNAIEKKWPLTLSEALLLDEII